MGETGAGQVVELVVDAIRSLGEERGSTAKNIVKYISANWEINEQTVKRIYTSLRRGVDDGRFQENEHRFSLNVNPEPAPPLLIIKGNPDGEEQEVSGSGKCLAKELAQLCKSIRRRRRRSKRSSCGKRRRRSRKRSSRGCARKPRRRSRCGRKRSTRRRSSRRRRSRCGC